MTPIREYGQSPGGRKRVNWNMVGAVIASAALLYGVFSGAFGDYRNTAERVKVLETQRAADKERADQLETSDKERSEKLERSIERIDQKLDALLQRAASR